MSTSGSTAPRLRVVGVRAYQRSAPTRMPFRFGAVTMTELISVFLRVQFETADGRRGEGVGASVLSPMWFDKAADRSYEEKARNLGLSMGLAAACSSAAGSATAYDLHRIVQPEVRRRCEALRIPALASSFGVALVDSALVDGLCRLSGATFHAGLRGDLFGFGAVPGLPEQPGSELEIRHTVGLSDPLTAADLGEPLADGLPETLEDVIREYGGRYFKVKISNDGAANLARLRRIAEVVEREAGADCRFVLDGNEQFEDMAAFVPFAEELSRDEASRGVYERLLWFEQPVEREAALADAVSADLRRMCDLRPVILDESDGTDETVERALALGYGGMSAKNCKGVFRTLHTQRVLAESGGAAVLSAEDLTNPPVLPLHQDTAVVTSLGCTHAERNAHHYVRGASFLTAREQEVLLRDFPSAYERTREGLVRLRIAGGVLETGEISRRGYGDTEPVDFDALEPMPLDEA